MQVMLFYIQTYAEIGTINTVFFINLFHHGKAPSSEGDIITELFSAAIVTDILLRNINLK